MGQRVNYLNTQCITIAVIYVTTKSTIEQEQRENYMSSILIDDEDWLVIQDWVHDDPDEFSDWEIDAEGNQIYEWIYTSLYEAEVIFQIDKKTGDSSLLQMRWGDQVLEPI